MDTIYNNKPIITFAGEQQIYSVIEKGLVDGLPEEQVEWIRSYGRATKSVSVEANFAPLTDQMLQTSGNIHTLLGKPFFHTYWTSCSDMDAYKATVKEDINQWLVKMKTINAYNWAIIVVETADSRKGNKSKLLPRASVLDKIKNDFCAKQQDRCIALLDMSKTDARGAESFQSLLQRLRYLVLQAYNQMLLTFEDYMRTRRECRNEIGWNFCDYFLLQEELVFILEILGLKDEALVQYDELDALLTQFILNSTAGDVAPWLSQFTRTCVRLPSLHLNPDDQKLFDYRSIIQEGNVTLLELRNYLFSRQCALLLALKRPWEVASRALSFLHNCINELKILQVELDEGSIPCWVFLSCMEVLHTCEEPAKDVSMTKEFSLHTAGLWVYARDKLEALGVFCGLMPGSEPISAQLHTVIILLAKLDSAEETSAEVQKIKGPSAQIKLHDALTNQQSFQKLYLELSELAMCTFKHVGRIRSARLIGVQLARFYLSLNEPSKAAMFLTDALNIYDKEGWNLAALSTTKALVRCYEATSDGAVKLIRMALLLASNSDLSLLERCTYFEKARHASRNLKDDILLSTERLFSFLNASISFSTSNYVISSTEIKINVNIQSHLPSAFSASTIKLSLKQKETVTELENPITGNMQQTCSSRLEKSLEFHVNFEYNQDRSLTKAGLVLDKDNFAQFLNLCRKDSSSGLAMAQLDITDRSAIVMGSPNILVLQEIEVIPGLNKLEFKATGGTPGRYKLDQLLIQSNFGAEFLCSHVPFTLGYDIKETQPNVYLNKTHPKLDLLAGIEQHLVLAVTAGSSEIEQGTTVKLHASRGLKLQVGQQPLQQELDCHLPTLRPFETINIPVIVIAEMTSQLDLHNLDKKVRLVCPWHEPDAIFQEVVLGFVSPFQITEKLNTANTRKFFQIKIQGLFAVQFGLCRQRLAVVRSPVKEQSDQVEEDEISVISMNPTDDEMVIYNDQAVTYVWEIVTSLTSAPPLKLDFYFDYCLHEPDLHLEFSDKKQNGPEWKTYKYHFELAQYKTLFSIRANVGPKTAAEFCRVGNMCHLNVQVSRVFHSNHNSLMYEVVVDSTAWAICGRTAGVVSMETDEVFNVTLDVMPLTAGFLQVPSVRLSKYIPADQKSANKDIMPVTTSCPRLEPFAQGQVYNWSKGQQVHVLAAPGSGSTNPPVSVDPVC